LTVAEVEAMPRRAWVLLKSGRRINLLEPTIADWEDEDLALGLSRTYRWGGHSAWDLPLSVAQHSLTVLALRQDMEAPPVTGAEAMRELLHDAEEGLLSWDPISPLKPYLGAEFQSLLSALKEVIGRRYRLPAWTPEAYAAHKHADRLAAASEAFHVVGWSIAEIRDSLEIELDPVAVDPVCPPVGMRPWEPWPPKLAASLFLAKLNELKSRVRPGEALGALSGG
jgi:5'-nucleotidase